MVQSPDRSNKSIFDLQTWLNYMLHSSTMLCCRIRFIRLVGPLILSLLTAWESDMKTHAVRTKSMAIVTIWVIHEQRMSEGRADHASSG